MLGLLAPLLCGMASGGVTQVHALALETPQTQSALGQALRLRFPVRLAAGEVLSPECVRAEVHAGEARIPANLLQLTLEGETEGSVRALRLHSSVAINEPLVSVTLSLGCPTLLTRQYTAFIDPAPVATAERNAKLQSAETLLATPRELSPALRAALATSNARPEVLLPDVKAGASVRAESADRQLAAASASAADGRSSAPRRIKPAKRQAAAALPPVPAQKEAQPARLLMEPPDRDEAESSPLAQVQAAEQALQRLRQIEDQLLQLRQNNQRAREKVQDMQKQLAVDAGPAMPSPWVAGLAVLSLGLSALCVSMWRTQKRREAAWWADAGAAAAAGRPEPAVATAVPAALSPSASRRVDSPGIAPSVPTARQGAGMGFNPADERTMSLATLEDAEADHLDLPRVAAAPGPAVEAVSVLRQNGGDGSRGGDAEGDALSIQLVEPASSFVNDTGAFTAPVPLNVTAIGNDHVTVEELIDLEQQVEFFLVLGQAEAAIELLQARINYGGASALPYLKLLEIHQRQGEQQLFAETAERFAQRFSALAPTWGSDLNLGRDLAAYPGALARIQQRWSEHAASMALLHDLLARGGDDARGFDLPAYRELLFLYGVARDLSEHEVRSDEIDLFLPLDGHPGADEGHDMMATMIWPHGQATPIHHAHHELALDISLDEPAPPTEARAASGGLSGPELAAEKDPELAPEPELAPRSSRHGEIRF